jgi:hypothetical protein
VDDGKGERKVWRVEKLKMVNVNEKIIGVFLYGE